MGNFRFDVLLQIRTRRHWKCTIACLSEKGGRHGESRFSEEQVAVALLQGDFDAPISELIRAFDIGQSTFYIWQKQYG